MRERDEGKIIDGRTRLKVCIELAIEPRIEDYTGDVPIAQYILATNLRRNLTKAQREQLLADFAQEILPPIIEKNNEQHSKGGKKAGRSRPIGVVRSDNTYSQPSVGTRYEFRKATGASELEAKQITAIHKNAPELLNGAEVAKHGGLAKTEKEARKRKALRETAKERAARLAKVEADKMSRPVLRGIPREEFAPDFVGSHTEYVKKYGLVQIEGDSAEKRATFNDRMLFSAWIKTLRDQLSRPLKLLVASQQWSQEQRLNEWLQRGKHRIKYDLIIETLRILQQAGEHAGKQLEWLEKKAAAETQEIEVRDLLAPQPDGDCK
jgi:hypothetical protein